MSLLDPNIQKYIVKWVGDKPTTKIKAKIENDNGENVGSIVSEGTIKRQMSLSDSKDAEILTIFSSVLRNKFEIKDSDENLIGPATFF